MSRYEDTSISLLRMPVVGTATSGPASIYSVTYTPASVNATTIADNATTVTLKGVAVGDYVVCIANPIATAVVLTNSRVTSADTVTCTFYNSTGGGVTPTSGTYKFLVIKA